MNNLRIISLLILSLFASAASADDVLPKTAEKFEVNGHPAYLYAAPTPAPGKPWLWYAPTLKGFSLAGKKMYFESFLRAGISLAGVDLGEVRGAPGSTEQFTLFYDEMSSAATRPSRSCSAKAGAD